MARGTKAFSFRLVVRVAFVLVVLGLLLAACQPSNLKTGIVTKYAQWVPTDGSTVQSYVYVRLDDGSELVVWLQQNDNIWTAMQDAALSGKVRIEFKYDGEFWWFMQIIEPK